MVISLIDDNLIELTESIAIQLTSVSGVASAVTTIISTTAGIIDIVDNDTSLNIQITATDPTAAEPILANASGSNVGVFQIVASNPAAFNYTIAYSLNGTASNGVDYSSVNGSPITTTLLIPANSTIINLNVVPIGDDIAEGNETLSLLLTSTSSVINGVTVVLSTSSAQIVLLDEDFGIGFFCY